MQLKKLKSLLPALSKRNREGRRGSDGFYCSKKYCMANAKITMFFILKALLLNFSNGYTKINKHDSRTPH